MTPTAIRGRTGTAALLCSLSLLAACASDPPAPAAQPSAAPVAATPPAAPRQAAPAPAAVARQAPAPARPVDPFADPSNPLSKRSVFYDYDESTVKAEYRPVVEAHAKYLRANPAAHINVEG